MIIDTKGRIFGKVNILDITLLAIFVLFTFIAIKFIFFKPNFFHYNNAVIEVNFNQTSLGSLIHMAEGKNYLHSDNNSYLVVPQTRLVRCNNLKEDITTIKRYKNDPRSVLAKTILIDCTNKTGGSGGEDITDPPMNWIFNCTYKFWNASEIYYDDLKINPDDYVCDANFLFNLTTRIIDGKPFYRNYEYQLSKGNYFNARTGDNVLKEGVIIAVYDNNAGSDNEKKNN